MLLNKVLSKETVTLDLQTNSKDGIIRELVDLLVAAGLIKDSKKALKAVMDREKLMSSGMQNGLAMPHGKTDSVDQLVAGIGIHKQGIDFEALDGRPSHIFVITLSPESGTGPHIQFLTEISRQINDPLIRERVLKARSREEVLDALTAA